MFHATQRHSLLLNLHLIQLSAFTSKIRNEVTKVFPQFFLKLLFAEDSYFYVREIAKQTNIFRIFQIAIFHTMSHDLDRFSTQFSKKFFTFCKGVTAISFEFNCCAAIVKVHLLFRNSRTPLSSFELCAWEILTRWSLSLSLFSITFRILRRELRFRDFCRRRTSIPSLVISLSVI